MGSGRLLTLAGSLPYSNEVVRSHKEGTKKATVSAESLLCGDAIVATPLSS